ncbi:hypothetical protein C8R43DRAFT_969053 [Mycena crocata]|nr:hypothetical protein C8R43DRAFT_969053 [Mycena crocata]
MPPLVLSSRAMDSLPTIPAYLDDMELPSPSGNLPRAGNTSHNAPQSANTITLSCGAEFEDVHGWDAHTSAAPHFLPSFAPAVDPPQRSAKAKSTGCGAVVHAQASGGRKWRAPVAGVSQDVIPLETAYFPPGAAAALHIGALGDCGCGMQGVGCRICGNALGAIFNPCGAHSGPAHAVYKRYTFLASAVSPPLPLHVDAGAPAPPIAFRTAGGTFPPMTTRDAPVYRDINDIRAFLPPVDNQRSDTRPIPMRRAAISDPLQDTPWGPRSRDFGVGAPSQVQGMRHGEPLTDSDIPAYPAHSPTPPFSPFIPTNVRPPGELVDAWEAGSATQAQGVSFYRYPYPTQIYADRRGDANSINTRTEVRSSVSPPPMLPRIPIPAREYPRGIGTEAGAGAAQGDVAMWRRMMADEQRMVQVARMMAEGRAYAPAGEGGNDEQPQATAMLRSRRMEQFVRDQRNAIEELGGYASPPRNGVPDSDSQERRDSFM